jgi:hypothetical protein
VKLDGQADLGLQQELKRRSKLTRRELGNGVDAVNQDEGQAEQEMDERDKAIEKQRAEVHALQRSIVAPMWNLIKLFGAVWVEQVRGMTQCQI